MFCRIPRVLEGHRGLKILPVLNDLECSSQKLFLRTDYKKDLVHVFYNKLIKPFFRNVN